MFRPSIIYEFSGGVWAFLGDSKLSFTISWRSVKYMEKKTITPEFSGILGGWFNHALKKTVQVIHQITKKHGTNLVRWLEITRQKWCHRKLKMLPVSLRNSWVCIWGHLLWLRFPAKKYCILRSIQSIQCFSRYIIHIYIYLIGCYVLSCLHILCIYIYCVYIYLWIHPSRKSPFKTHTCFLQSLEAIPVETDDEVSTPGTSEVQNRRLKVVVERFPLWEGHGKGFPIWNLIWVFPKIVGVSPQIIRFNWVFHDFHHPFWGTTILGNHHFDWFWKSC